MGRPIKSEDNAKSTKEESLNGETDNDETSSLVEGLFYGEINEQILFPYPDFSKEQKEMGKEMCSAIAKYFDAHINGAKMDEEAKIPPEVYKGIGELGLYGLGVSEDLGGMGLDNSLYARVFAQVASMDGSLATMLGAHQSIGYKALLLYGNDQQKKKWLPRLSSGEVLASFCLTEPGAGSDAYSIKTKAVQNKDGTYTINGQKLWITNGGIAGFYSVFAKTDHDEDGKKHEKITCFIVEKGTAGLSFGEKENKMGIRASETRAVFFDNVIVPDENVIGEPGKGFKIAMNVLNTGRLSLGSGCVGGMKTMLKLATTQASGRKQFDRTITEFGMIQEKLAQMAALTYATESVVYLTTGLIDRGMEEYFIESAICKVFGSESLWSVVDMGLQIAAGSGYMKEYPYERIMRDARINLIFEGTNEILRAFIALSGMRGPSESLSELGKVTDVAQALKDPIKSLGVLTDFAKSRISKMIGSSALTLHHPDLHDLVEKIPSLVDQFSICVEDTLIKYGTKVIDNELPLKRLADMAIELYVMLAVISRTTSILGKDSIKKKEKDYVMQLTKYILSDFRHKFIRNQKRMDKNSDKIIKSLTKDIVDFGGYGLDIMDL